MSSDATAQPQQQHSLRITGDSEIGAQQRFLNQQSEGQAGDNSKVRMKETAQQNLHAESGSKLAAVLRAEPKSEGQESITDPEIPKWDSSLASAPAAEPPAKGITAAVFSPEPKLEGGALQSSAAESQSNFKGAEGIEELQPTPAIQNPLADTEQSVTLKSERAEKQSPAGSQESRSDLAKADN